GAIARCSTCRHNDSLNPRRRARPMMSSPKSKPGIEPLPPTMRSMWRLCKLGYRHEPRMMIVALVLSQLAALPDALLALLLMVLGKGVVEHRPDLVQHAALRLAL